MEVRPDLAPTMELVYKAGDKEMAFYMVAGCCGTRSMWGFNGATPEQVIEGIVMSGISGCQMIITDAYTDGKDARAFVEWIAANLPTDIGTAIVSPGQENDYTGNMIYAVVLNYSIAKLSKWHMERTGGGDWSKPDGWATTNDAVWMDHVFYQYGGRPKLASMVTSSGIFVKEEEEAA